MSKEADLWRQVDKRRKPLLRSARKRFVKHFELERIILKQHLKGVPVTQINGRVSALLDSENNKEALTRAFFDTCLEGVTSFGKWMTEQLSGKKASGFGITPWYGVVEETPWYRAAQDWIDVNGAEKVAQVTAATKDQIGTVVSVGILQGKGADKIAADIDTLYLKQIIPNRSDTIARTETTFASNYGSRTAAKELGLNLKKKWLATPDIRTRPAHAAMMDKPYIDMDEPYVVGGQKLMYPGDYSLGASAWNVINCRCCEAYQTIDEPMPVQATPVARNLPVPRQEWWHLDNRRNLVLDHADFKAHVAQFKPSDVPVFKSHKEASTWVQKNIQPKMEWDMSHMPVENEKPMMEAYLRMCHNCPETGCRWLRYTDNANDNTGWATRQNVYAHTRAAGTEGRIMVSVNPKYFTDLNKLQTSYHLDMASGYHPKTGSGSNAIDAIVTHELGHSSLDVGHDFMTVWNFNRGDARSISRYANQDWDEGMAETYALVKIAPKSMWPMQNKLVQQMITMMRDHYGAGII